MAEIPQNARESAPWPLTEILDVSKVTAELKQEGMCVADVDADGKPDLIAGMFWFKHLADCSATISTRSPV
ncbi:MAG: FG-GAP repeat protein [Acidobacteriota bacterium]